MNTPVSSTGLSWRTCYKEHGRCRPRGGCPYLTQCFVSQCRVAEQSLLPSCVLNGLCAGVLVTQELSLKSVWQCETKCCTSAVVILGASQCSVHLLWRSVVVKQQHCGSLRSAKAWVRNAIWTWQRDSITYLMRASVLITKIAFPPLTQVTLPPWLNTVCFSPVCLQQGNRQSDRER